MSSTSRRSALSACIMITQNSSPPMRPTKSSERKLSRSTFATHCSTRSPTSWPYWSLKVLKWSTSTIIMQMAPLSAPA